MADHDPISVPELETDFLFRRQPVAIPGDLRPGWRIGLLVLLLKNCCRSGRTSLARLHVLNWAIRTAENRQALRLVIAGDLAPQTLVVRVEPFLNRAIDFAVAEGLVRRLGGSKLELAPQGKGLAEDIEKIAAAFTKEKQYIDEIGQKVSEAMVDKIFGGGG